VGKLDQKQIAARIEMSSRTTKRTLVLVLAKGRLPEAITELLLVATTHGASWHHLQEADHASVAQTLLDIVGSFEAAQALQHEHRSQVSSIESLEMELKMALGSSSHPPIIIQELAKAGCTVLDIAVSDPASLQRILDQSAGLHLSGEQAQLSCDAVAQFLQRDAICRK